VTGEPAATDEWRRFDSWASVLFLVLAAVTLVASLLVGSGLASSGASPAFALLLVATGVATACVQWLGWWGLQGPKPWGRPAATWILALTVVAGVFGLVVDLTQSRLSVPIAAIAAVVILARRPGPVVADRAAIRRGAIVGVALLLLTLAPTGLTWAATSPASPLVASADDLDIAIAIDCVGPAGTMPERVDVTVSWTWDATDAVVAGPDGVGIGWTDDPDGESRFALESSSVSDETTLVPGGAGLAGGVVDATLAPLQPWTWAVEAANGRHGPGEVRLTLVPAATVPDRPADGQLLVQFVYAHLDRWTVEDGGRCEW
jgi:hypothetical protein